jgi:hypothetical protein
MYGPKCGDLLKKTGKEFECVEIWSVSVHGRTSLRLVHN